MKRFMYYFLLSGFVLAGCATTESVQRKKDIVNFSIKSYPNAEIKEFNTSKDLENYQEFSSAVRVALMQYLPTEGIFNKVVSYYDDRNDPKGVIVIEATLLSVKSVSKKSRLMLGMLAGRSSIEMAVVLKDKSTGEVLGENVILVQSSPSSGIFSASDQETINQIAREIALYLSNLK